VTANTEVMAVKRIAVAALAALLIGALLAVALAQGDEAPAPPGERQMARPHGPQGNGAPAPEPDA